MASESCIWLSPEGRATLEGWVADRNAPQKLVWRARIVLMWAGNAGVTAIVRATGKTKRTAYRWRDRYVERGVEGLKRDASRPGAQGAAVGRDDRAGGAHDAPRKAAGGARIGRCESSPRQWG